MSQRKELRDKLLEKLHKNKRGSKNYERDVRTLFQMLEPRERAALRQLVIIGPMQMGTDAFSSSRDELVSMGLAVRVAKRRSFDWTAANVRGWDVCNSFYKLKEFNES